MRVESVISPLSAGAGRLFDWVWPDVFSHDANISAAVRPRNGQGDPSVGLGETVAIAGGSTVTAGVLNGVWVASFNVGGAGQATCFRFPNAGFFHVKTSKNNIPPGLDDTSAKRLITIMAAFAAPAAGQDFGIQYVRRANNGIQQTGNDGWGVNLTSLANAQFIVRGPNGLITQNFAVNTAVLHAYEFRILDATATTDASLQFLIDGVPQALAPLSSSWGPGTNLPPEAAVASVTGWQPLLIPNSGTGPNALFVNQQRVILAPTLLMTQ